MKFQQLQHLDALSQNTGVVLFGMVTTYLPFMFFPIYVALEKMDFSQQEAAMDLGATPLRAFVKVVLPQIRPAIATGLIMVCTQSRRVCDSGSSGERRSCWPAIW